MANVTRTALDKISTLQIYRDLLRVANRVGEVNNNQATLRKMVSDEFRKHRYESDKEKIAKLREEAIGALSNYLVLESQKLVKKGQTEQLDLSDLSDDETHNNGGGGGGKNG